METVRRYITLIASVTGLFAILLEWTMQIQLRGVFIAATGIVLLNQAIDELMAFSRTKKKFHLVIPAIVVCALIVVIFVNYFGK